MQCKKKTREVGTYNFNVSLGLACRILCNTTARERPLCIVDWIFLHTHSYMGPYSNIHNIILNIAYIYHSAVQMIFIFSQILLEPIDLSDSCVTCIFSIIYFSISAFIVIKSQEN